jgi:hypothetical protein
MQLRELRFAGPEIAETLGMPLLMVGAVLGQAWAGRPPRKPPEGRHYRWHRSSGRLVVLVDEAAKPIATLNVTE